MAQRPSRPGRSPLAGGDDGTVPVTDAGALADALAVINPELGPGQVLAPGRSTMDDHAALLAHAAATNRYAILDGGVHDDALALQSAAELLRGADEDRYGMLWGPWAVVPGIAPGTSRTVPWSPVQAALCARNDLAPVTPTRPPRARSGQTQWVTDLTQRFTPAECETLLYARRGHRPVGVRHDRGVRVPGHCRTPPGTIRRGCRPTTAAWPWPSSPRAKPPARTSCSRRSTAAASTSPRSGGALAGDLITFYNAGALYGDDSTEAFVVNVGPAVNTPAKLADGVLSAVVSVRMSPHAELVQIQIVKQPITVSLV